MKTFSLVLNFLFASTFIVACLASDRRAADQSKPDQRGVGVDLGIKAPTTQTAEIDSTQAIQPLQQGGWNFSVVLAAATGGGAVFLMNKVGDVISDCSRERSNRVTLLIFAWAITKIARGPP